MSRRQTDNSHLWAKVALRNKHLPSQGQIAVLDCFAGTGKIWERVKSSNPDRQINVLGIDVKNIGGGIYLRGDNRKFLGGMDLAQFDIIDLDAYGVPYQQIKSIIGMSGKAIFATFIQKAMGSLNRGLLAEIGYPKTMIAKCPSLFARDGWHKFKTWLYSLGVREISHYTFGEGLGGKGNVHYIYFKI